jgi:hypothetical protein
MIAFASFFCAEAFGQPCLSAKPKPHCGAFFITEFGYGYKATSPLKRRTFNQIGDSTSFYEYELTGRHLLVSELGLMHNLNANYGLGFTHFLGWDVGHHLHGGVKLRVRKWLNERASLDISGGPLLWGAEGEFDYPGFTGGVSLNLNEWESLSLTVTSLHTQSYEYAYVDYDGKPFRNFAPRQNELAVFAGYKFASKPGLALNAAALVSFGYVLALFLTNGYD